MGGYGVVILAGMGKAPLGYAPEIKTVKVRGFLGRTVFPTVQTPLYILFATRTVCSVPLAVLTGGTIRKRFSTCWCLKRSAFLGVGLQGGFECDT